MAEQPDEKKKPSDRFREEVGAKEKRKLKAERHKDRDVWFGLGMFGLVGWSVALPTLLGGYRYLDRHQMAQPVFMDPDVSLYRSDRGLFECLVLGQTGESTGIDPTRPNPYGL